MINRFFQKDRVIIVAGPCAVESLEQLLATGEVIKSLGLTFFRGGAFKPRTSPYSFQGLEEEGLKLLSEVKKRFGFKIVTELTDADYLDLMLKYVDIIQIGARNMDNYSLLKKVGQATARNQKPVLLKRSFAATVEEWLLASEYITSAGNQNVILCERGIRTFEKATRFTLDLNAVPVVKKLTRLPILVDASHGTGHAEFVMPLSRAAVAAGADGIMVEVHPNPRQALCDGAQSLDLKEFRVLFDEVKKIATALNKRVV